MKKYINITIALLGWFAVIAQFCLMYLNRTTSVFEMIVRFFSFFTILTNTLVAIYFTYPIFCKKGNNKFFKNENSLLPITVYITIVGLVYQIILRHVWQPTGLQMIVDELLHTAIPLLVIIYWFNQSTFIKLNLKRFVQFLLYPIFYIIYILTRGYFSDFYPYPFIDVNEIGISTTIINIIGLIVLFSVIHLIFHWISKLLVKK